MGKTARSARGGARALMSISNLNFDDFLLLGRQSNLKSEETTVCMRKSVGCHFFVATVLGLASELNLIVVGKHFR